jgi:hypothetical protein
MTVGRANPTFLIGLALVALVAVGVPVALDRQGTAAATVPVAALSATDRRVLASSRPLIEGLPTALSQLPLAASDASDGRVSPAQARSLMARTPALAPLSRAVAAPATATAELEAAYRAVLGRHAPASPDALPDALQRLQTIEGQIEPAIRLAAARGGIAPSAAGALDTLEHDRRVRALTGLVAGWQQVYGSFTLVEQAAAAAAS